MIVFLSRIRSILAILVAFAPQYVFAAYLRSRSTALAHVHTLAETGARAKFATWGAWPSNSSQSGPSQNSLGRLVPGQQRSLTPHADSKQGKSVAAAFHPFQSMCGGMHFIFNLPPDLKPGNSARGLFIMLHACQRTASSFFTLPEEAAMTTAVLRRGFTVAVPDTPPGRYGNCWDILADGRTLAKAIPQVQQQLHLETKPLYAVGISSGGMLLASLVKNFRVPFSGINFNASPQNSQMFQGVGIWPRASFVHAEGDRWAPSQKVLSAADALKRRGTPVQVFSTGPKPLEELPNHATQLGIDAKILSHAVDLLRWAGFTRMFSGDTPGTFKGQLLTPYSTDNALAYLKRSDIGNAIIGHGGGLTEEMNILSAVHGPTSEHFEEVLDFLVGQKSRSSAASFNTTKL